MLHGGELTLHALEELLFINVAIQVPENFLATIVPNSAYMSAYAQDADFRILTVTCQDQER
jgi:hypothetical protein